MEKSEVIKIRTALKGGKNLPLIVMIDNSFDLIDENNKTQFVKWDDDNGILYHFRLTDMQSDRSPSNESKTLSICATTYDMIQAIEVPRLPLDCLEDVIGTIEEAGVTFKPEFKDSIIYTYNELLHSDRWKMTHKNINAMLGTESLNTKDEYYDGRFTENFKETAAINRYNKRVEERNSESGDDTPTP
jgi:hypothetical protein